MIRRAGPAGPRTNGNFTSMTELCLNGRVQFFSSAASKHPIASAASAGVSTRLLYSAL